MLTGSMSYQLSNSAVILDQVTCRSFADGLRSIAVDRRVPSQEERDQFDVFIKLTDADDPFSFEPTAQET